MNEPFPRLTDSLPPRRLPARSEFAFDPKALRDQLAQLPLANPVATAVQLAELLAAMNGLVLDPQLRIDALETLRKPVQDIVRTLDHQLRGDSVPLPQAKLQIAHRAQAFEAQMIDGYLLALDGFVGAAGKVPFMKTRSVALAVTRALQHAGARLDQVYLSYEVPPPGAWRCIHQLYCAANFLGVETRSMPDPLLGTAEVSASDAYAHILLLALCNPYRFNQHEMGELREFTRALAPYCLFGQGAGGGVFAVHTDSDRSLGYFPEEREAACGDYLAFDPMPAARLVRDEFGRLPHGADAVFRLRRGPRVRISGTFAERVLRSWSGSIERGHVRLTAGHRLDAVIGLHALHYELTGGEDFDTFVRRVRGQAIALGERETASWAMSGAATRPVRLAARVLDQSLGGYRLAFDAIDPLRAKVGEIIGLATPAPVEELQDWMVGVIRWIRSEPDGGVSIGVELAARRAQPIGLASFGTTGLPRPPMRAVLLLGHDDVALTMLAPHLFDRHAKAIELTRPADPLDWQAAPSVMRFDDVSVIDASGAYRRVIVGRPPNEHEIADALPETESMSEALIES